MKKIVLAAAATTLLAIPVAVSARLYSTDQTCNIDADNYARRTSHAGPGNPFYENARDRYLLDNCPGVEDDSE